MPIDPNVEEESTGGEAETKAEVSAIEITPKEGTYEKFGEHVLPAAMDKTPVRDYWFVKVKGKEEFWYVASSGCASRLTDTSGILVSALPQKVIKSACGDALGLPQRRPLEGRLHQLLLRVGLR